MRSTTTFHGRPMCRRPARPRGALRPDERGDVPGWVLITLMTAALVSALWIVAEDQLVALFTDALASVGG